MIGSLILKLISVRSHEDAVTPSINEMLSVLKPSWNVKIEALSVTVYTPMCSALLVHHDTVRSAPLYVINDKSAPPLTSNYSIMSPPEHCAES